MDGLTACQEAQACEESCGPIIAECDRAFTIAGRGFLCPASAYGRCQRHGVAYCAASPTTANGCNRVAAEDHRGESTVTVTFAVDGAGYDYSPECIIVSPGTTVRFEGPFALEPLVGGTPPDADPSSPFSPTTAEGTRHDFVLSAPGTFPYFGGDFGSYSDTGLLGLPWGAVIVDAEPR